MQEDNPCQKLCETDPIPIEDAKFINKVVTDGYAINWAVDGLPAATEDIDQRTNETYFNIGFKLGTTSGDVPYLNNHYNIIIHYHITNRNLARVVGVIVKPLSRNTNLKSDDMCTEIVAPFHLKEDGKSTVVYTYSVNWIVKYFVCCIGSFSHYFI